MSSFDIDAETLQTRFEVALYGDRISLLQAVANLRDGAFLHPPSPTTNTRRARRVQDEEGNAVEEEATLESTVDAETDGDDELLWGIEIGPLIFGCVLIGLAFFSRYLTAALLAIFSFLMGTYQKEVASWAQRATSKVAGELGYVLDTIKQIEDDDESSDADKIAANEKLIQQSREQANERVAKASNIRLCIRGIATDTKKLLPKQIKWVIGPYLFQLGLIVLDMPDTEKLLGLRLLPTTYFVCNIITVAGVWIVGNSMIAIIEKRFSEYAQSTASFWDDVLIPVFGQILSAVWSMVFAISVLTQLGVDSTSLTVVLGSGSLALALAMSTSVSDWVGLYTIISANLFTIGDWIVFKDGTIGTIDGRVEHVGLSKTTVRGWGRQVFYIPNAKFISGTVLNWSLSQKYLIKFNWHIAHGVDMAKATAMVAKLEKYMHDHPQLATGTGIHPRCIIDQIEATGSRVELYCYWNRGGMEMRTEERGPKQMRWWKDWQLMKQDLIVQVQQAMKEFDLPFGYDEVQLLLSANNASKIAENGNGGGMKPQ